MAKFYKPINNKQIVFPVGAIYLSIQEDNPSKYFGGTWEQIKGRFLVGCGSNGVDLYTDAGQTGGEANHLLTVQEMPTHAHGGICLAGRYYLTAWNDYNGSVTAFNLDGDYRTNCSAYGDEVSNSFGTNYKGGGSSHNNLPPYLSVYMWKRTA